MNPSTHVIALFLVLVWNAAMLLTAICVLAFLVGRFIRTGEGDDKPLPPQSIRGGGVFMDRSGR